MCCPVKTRNFILNSLRNIFKFVINTRSVLHKSPTSKAPPTSKAMPTSQAPPNSQTPNQINVHDDDVEKTLITEISYLPENFLPKSCGDIDTSRIFGGNIAGMSEFPWMVALYYEVGKYYSMIYLKYRLVY